MLRIILLLGVFLCMAVSVAAAEPVAEMQQLLADRDCYSGTMDGAWGPMSQAAADRFCQGLRNRDCSTVFTGASRHPRRQ
jgi:hypothetical protein